MASEVEPRIIGRVDAGQTIGDIGEAKHLEPREVLAVLRPHADSPRWPRR